MAPMQPLMWRGQRGIQRGGRGLFRLLGGWLAGCRALHGFFLMRLGRPLLAAQRPLTNRVGVFGLRLGRELPALLALDPGGNGGILRPLSQRAKSQRL